MLSIHHSLTVDLAQMLETTTTPMAPGWEDQSCPLSPWLMWALWLSFILFQDVSQRERKPGRLTWRLEWWAARETRWRIWPRSHFPSSWGGIRCDQIPGPTRFAMLCLTSGQGLLVHKFAKSSGTSWLHEFPGAFLRVNPPGSKLCFCIYTLVLSYHTSLYAQSYFHGIFSLLRCS